MRKRDRAAVLAVATALGVMGLVLTLEFAFALRSHDAQATLEARDADRVRALIAERVRQTKRRLRDIGVVLREAARQGGSLTSAFHAYAEQTSLLMEHPEMGGAAFWHRFEAGAFARGASDPWLFDYNSDPGRSAIGYGRLGPAPGDPAAASTEPRARTILTMMAPLSSGLLQAGRDMAGTPLEWAMQRAATQRRTVLTRRVSLMLGAPGTAVVAPIYFDSGDAAPAGFVTTEFIGPVFLDELATSLASMASHVEIHDVTGRPTDATLGAETFLASTDGAARFGRAETSLAGPLAWLAWLTRRPDPVLTRDISLVGPRWRILVTPKARPGIGAQLSLMTTLGAIAAGLAGALVWRLRTASQRLSGEVSNRTLALNDALEELDARRRAAERAANQDELTGLLSRRGFAKATAAQLSEGGAEGALLAMVSVDLDGFKEINDVLGHASGDRLLRHVGEGLSDILGDRALLARMGGDEFLASMVVSDPQEPRRLAERALAFAQAPVLLEGEEMRFGMSVGIARQPLAEADLESIQVESDLAMYQAKRSGKNQIQEYDEVLRSRAVRNKTLSDELRGALERGEFEPWFQTQHDAGTGAVVGVEALARWRHPTRGVLSPDRFLPVAETIGIVKQIDLIVMRAAVETVRRLEKAGLGLPKVGVNVSLSRLRDGDLIASIAELPTMRAALSFEILEAVFLDEFDDLTRVQLDQLREMGVGLEIDDFGTGRTSIVALTRLGPDRIKVDRELALRVETDEAKRRIVKSIVDMAGSLGVATTVEGVESAAQARALAELGAGALQGYHFGAPCAEADLTERLRRAAAA